MRILFFKHQLTWPRQSGHDVHTAELMRALVAAGHHVEFVSRVPAEAGAVDGLGLARRCRAARIDVLSAVGLDALPYLAGPHEAVAVWYAADEWVLHHLSQVRPADRSTWGNLRDAGVKGLYERAFSSAVDRVWVVTEKDRWAARWIAGMRSVDVIPNGVDADWFAPRPVQELPETAVFWGRLDFGPNIQALQWFVDRVWKTIVQQRPSARFQILGFKASDEVRRLAATPGIELRTDVPDLRDDVCRHAVAVVPMVSGLGIKNKLLEAAALARPIVCTPTATLGLHLPARPPFIIVERADDWISALVGLWRDEHKRHALGTEARAWVNAAHSWTAAAERALQGLTVSLAGRRNGH
jgi:polysaccharide biosynthesis protein PslH